MLRQVLSDRLRVTVAPKHGFTITAIELLDGGENVLWQPADASFHDLPATELGPAGEASIDSFDRSVLAGGWFPMFPTAGLPGTSADRWMHGEAPRIAWSVVDESDSHLTAVVDTPATDIRVHRTLRVADDMVTVTTRAENRSGRDQHITFGEHPCFSRAVFAGGSLLADPARAVVTSAADPLNARLLPGQEFRWPGAPDARGGSLDQSSLPRVPDGRHDHVSLTGISRMQLRGDRHVVDLEWDAIGLPNALVWQHFRPTGSPWNGDVFAIEPMSAPGRTFDDAVAAESVTNLADGQTLETWMSMRITPVVKHSPSA